MVRHNHTACQSGKICHACRAEYRRAFPGRPGQHHDMHAVRFKHTARCGTPVVGQYPAACRQHGLLHIVLGHLSADLFKKCGNPPQRWLVQHQLFAKCLCDGFTGQIIQCGAQTAGGNNQIRPFAGNVQHFLQPFRIVSHYGLIIDINAQLIQTHGNHLRIGVYNVTQQDFRAYCNHFCFHLHSLLSEIHKKNGQMPYHPSASGRTAPASISYILVFSLSVYASCCKDIVSHPPVFGKWCKNGAL